MHDQQPNILFILCDQLRWDALGVSGGWVDTPHCDRLASEGVRFDSAITNCPVCVPARISLATGLYPHSYGLWANGPRGRGRDPDGNDLQLDPRWPTWMAALRAAGYATTMAGKTHLHGHHGDLRDREHLLHAYGLDLVDEIGGPRASASVLSHMTEEWQRLGLWDAYREDYRERFANRPWVARPSTLPLDEYADCYVGRKTREHLAGLATDTPWFCWMSFGGPHEPWDCPDAYADRYDPAAMPAAIPRPDWFDRLDNDALGARDRQRSRAGRPSDAEVAALRANYAGNVSLIDDEIGKTLELLEERGELDNTVIVLTADHGEANGDHGQLYKETFLDPAARIPLIIRTPGSAQAGAVCEAPVELIDVGATLVELAGADWAVDHQARSLVPQLVDPQAPGRDEALCEYGGELMLLSRQWKCWFARDGHPVALIDRRGDPHEQHNRVDDPACAEVVAGFRNRAFGRLLSSHLQRPGPSVGW